MRVQKLVFMKIKILSWNVMGANNAEKRKLMKAYLKMQKVDLVAFRRPNLKKLHTGL